MQKQIVFGAPTYANLVSETKVITNLFVDINS